MAPDGDLKIESMRGRVIHTRQLRAREICVRVCAIMAHASLAYASGVHMVAQTRLVYLGYPG